MENWMLSLILAAVISVIVVISDSGSENKNKMSQGIKVFVISFAIIYLGLMYFGSDRGLKHDINTGEPPF
jgi:hypothetical protein